MLVCHRQGLSADCSSWQVHVHVAYAGPGRGHVVLAKQDMAQGDILAAIPIDVCWIFDQHGANGSVDVSAVGFRATHDPVCKASCALPMLGASDVAWCSRKAQIRMQQSV